uniref:Uncharacterized protein n=1 Tax=Medicago truncatula TaxID=3880 RepID=Q2HUB3_MEDTR|nr:hypothetical protein MtrDRAFT_AC149206g36v2 [Medicago truncatula]
MILRPSATMKKRKGKIGSPCHNPLSNLNSLIGHPFTRTDAEAAVKHSMIHFHQRVGKFILIITTCRYL